MLKIGLTGGIGSGKTTVSRYFSELGMPVIDADEIVHKLMQPDQVAYREIVDAFGHSILDRQNTIDRARLRQVVFDDSNKRKRLEDILHPRVREQIETELETLNADYCVLVIPLLIEAGYVDFVDQILVIDIDETTQINRVKQRNGFDAGQAKKIIAAQIDRQQRLSYANDVINNNETLERLKQQVSRLHKHYLSLAAKQAV